MTLFQKNIFIWPNEYLIMIELLDWLLNFTAICVSCIGDLMLSRVKLWKALLSTIYMHWNIFNVLKSFKNEENDNFENSTYKWNKRENVNIFEQIFQKKEKTCLSKSIAKPLYCYDFCTQDVVKKHFHSHLLRMLTFTLTFISPHTMKLILPTHSDIFYPTWI